MGILTLSSPSHDIILAMSNEIDMSPTPDWETGEALPEPQNGHAEIPEEHVQRETEESLSNEEEDQETITFRRSHLYALLLPLAFVLGLSVGYLFWGRISPIASTATLPGTTSGAAAVTGNEQAQTSAGQAAAQNQTTGQDPYQQVVRYDVPIDDDPINGPDNAAITIIEFSDFECPYCRQWHEQVYNRLFQTYSGQIRIVYRDFPLTSIHPNAFPAAEAANCAGEQGVYWAYHDQLFGQEFGLGKDAYQQYAEQLNLNMASFNACLDSGKYQAEIQADFEYAAQLGVRSTPTFFINGIALVGAQPFEVFQQVIDKELAGEIP